jgi:hypothetical protein
MLLQNFGIVALVTTCGWPICVKLGWSGAFLDGPDFRHAWKE